MRKIKVALPDICQIALMSDHLARYAARNVPRYTSYPTAPHFSAEVTPGLYGSWLAGLPEETDLSLYLHVPYCRELCHYCGCHTKATRKDAPLVQYAKSLEAEIELVAGHLGAQRRVRHIHWGGGTPSLLPEASLLELSGMIRVLFDLTPDLEHAIELDPRYVTRRLALTLAVMGINRASLGVQDLNPDVQKAIGRVQSYEVLQAAVDHLRDAGLDALNFDLMYGLPLQTRDTILDTVARSVALQPSRIALFGYAHVPWMKKHQRLIDETTLPAPAERLAMADAAREALMEAGYVAIGLDHFARPDDSMAIALAEGRLKRNFQGYTTDQGEALIGLGVSSIGRLPAGFVQNVSDTGTWQRMVENGQLPVNKGFALSDDDRARADIIEQLMTSYTVDVARIAEWHGLPLSHFSESLAKLEELSSDGLLTCKDAWVKITPEGRPYVRIAAAAFDAYFGKAAPSAVVPRHSMAV